MQRLGSISISLFLGAVVLGGCGDDGGTTPTGPVTAIAVSGDFAVTGVFSTIDVEGGTVHANALAGVAGGDPVVRVSGGEVFIVNRDMGENVTVLGGDPLALVDQFGTGGGSNPQDVAQVGTKLYIPALGSAGVVVIDRANRAMATITIPGDTDGHPDCVSAYAVGTKVYVACGLLDDTFTPRGNTQISVIDTATDTVASSFELTSPNPVGMFVETPATSMFGGDLLIATAPAFNDFTTGCLARVKTGATPAANGCVATNQAMAGLANHVSIAPDGTKAWLAVTGFSADFSSQFGRLHSIDLATGTVSAAVSATAQQIVDVAACRDGYLIASDGTMGASGVRIWKDGVETTTAALDIGRPTGVGNNLACF
jgi:hypothetical protein